MAALLSEMSQSWTRATFAEAADAALMRVADDPLLVQAVLRELQTRPPQIHGRTQHLAAALPFFRQRDPVSFQDRGTINRERAYVWREAPAAVSGSAYRFMPSKLEREAALENEEPSTAANSRRRQIGGPSWPVLLALALGPAVLMGCLLLSLQ